MTVDASTSTPGSGTYRAIKTPPTLAAPPLRPPAGSFAGIPCPVVTAAMLDEAVRIADHAKRLRLRNDRTRADATAWLAARGLSPTAAPRP